MKSALKLQYAMVQGSRQALLDYCATMQQCDFIQPAGHFGRGGSARSLLVHINDVYHRWLGEFALHKKPGLVNGDAYTTVADVRSYFNVTDELMFEFLSHFETDYFVTITNETTRPQTVTTPFEIFTHVITHEFHHKGQILSITRALGYIPIDSDVIR